MSVSPALLFRCDHVAEDGKQCEAVFIQSFACYPKIGEGCLAAYKAGWKIDGLTHRDKHYCPDHGQERKV